MSRRRAGMEMPEGMPERLVRYRPEEWCSDPSDLVDWYYFGRHRWSEARQEWAERCGVTSRSLVPES